MWPSIFEPGIPERASWKTQERQTRGGGHAPIAELTIAIECNDETYVTFAADWLQQQAAFQDLFQAIGPAGVYHLQHRVGS